MNTHSPDSGHLFQDLSIPGTFAPSARARLYLCPGASRVVVNLHGSYGNMESHSGKYRRFAEDIHASGKAHAVLLESSRHEGDFSHLHDPLHRRVAPFHGKIFDQELGDFRNLLSTLHSRSHELFGRDADRIDWILNGNSLGGLICLFLAAEFQGISLISTVSSGLRLSAEGVEGNKLAMTMPHPEALCALAAFYQGPLMISWGTKDSIFSEADCRRLQTAFSSASSSDFQIYPGINHSFDSIDGVDSETPYRELANKLLAKL